MRKSVGIGSQISQISGVYYPTRIDNYCKIVKGMKYYGRYMDKLFDELFIHPFIEGGHSNEEKRDRAEN